MTHADPWDEIARLERQMDAELLRQLEDPLPDVLTRSPSQGPSSGAAGHVHRFAHETLP
jgi:hypothetical protein